MLSFIKFLRIKYNPKQNSKLDEERKERGKQTVLRIGMFIPDPGSRFLIFVHTGSRIPDPKTATKERGENKFFVTFFWNHKNHKIENYINFELVKKKSRANLQRIIELSIQKNVIKLSKICGFGIWDLGSGIRGPGSGKNLIRIPDPGVTKAPDPPQHCKQIINHCY